MINWTNLNLNPNNGNQVADWTIPQVSTANAFLRVIKGSDTSIVGPFVILNQPNTITLDWVCPDSLKVTASPVSGASSYSVFMLGNKYMDSVTTTSSNSIVISHQASSSSWLSVSGNINNQHGKRSYPI